MSTASLQSQLIDFWKEDADPFVSTLFGIQSPGSFLTIVVGIALLIKRNERNSRMEKEPVYVKPALLVLYGLLFGVNGAGCLLALAGKQEKMIKGRKEDDTCFCMLKMKLQLFHTLSRSPLLMSQCGLHQLPVP